MLPVTVAGGQLASLAAAAAASAAAAGRAAVAAAGRNFCRPRFAGTPAAPSGSAAGPARPPACTSASLRQGAASIPGPLFSLCPRNPR